jgi:SnoaL-like domain
MKSIVVTGFVFLALGVACATGTTSVSPQRTPQEVVNEHLDALNHCDYARLMALYPPEAHLFLPGGQVVNGREQVAAIYRQTVKPFKDGGACGLKFEAQTTFTVGTTVNVQWSATADFLEEPYLGADAYVTQGGLMWAQVSTWNRAEIRAKAP